MKKLLIVSVLVASGLSAASAQEMEHIIEVARFRDWGKDYLTITNGGYCTAGPNDDVGFVTWTPEYGSLLPCSGYIITEIDGVSTKEMGTSAFYEILDSPGVRTLTVLGWETKIMIKKRDNREDSETFQHTNFYDLYGNRSLEKIDWSYEDSQLAECDIIYSELIDSDYDWGDKIYGYKLSEEDRLTDKVILDKLTSTWLPLRLDNESPDVIFSVSKTKQTDGYTLELSATDVSTPGGTLIWKMTFVRSEGLPAHIEEEWGILATLSRKLPWRAHYRDQKTKVTMYNIVDDNGIVSWIREDSSPEQSGLREGDEIVAFQRDGSRNWIKYYDGCYRETTPVKQCKIKRDGRVLVIKNLEFSTLQDVRFEGWGRN